MCAFVRRLHTTVVRSLSRCRRTHLVERRQLLTATSSYPLSTPGCVSSHPLSQQRLQCRERVRVSAQDRCRLLSSTGISLGKVPRNERMILEWTERQNIERRQARLREAIRRVHEAFDLPQENRDGAVGPTDPRVVSALREAEYAPLLREALESVNGPKLHNSTNKNLHSEQERYVSETLRLFRPAEWSQSQRKRKELYDKSVEAMFRSWKSTADDVFAENQAHQFGKAVNKQTAARYLESFMGVAPTSAEIDRMWLQKELRFGSEYEGVHIPLG